MNLAIRPLTLFFGYNSSGKSALVRALPLLAASAQGESLSPIDLNSQAARGSSYREIASRFSKRNAMVFTLGWSNEQVKELSVQFRDLPDQNRHIIEEFGATVRDKSLRMQFLPADQTDTYSVSSGKRQITVPIEFRGLRPQLPERFKDETIKSLVADVSKHLAEFASGVHWLTAVRTSVPRHTNTKNEIRMGPSGEGADSILVNDWMQNRELFDEINEWYVRMFRHELRVDESVEGSSLVVVPAEGAPVSTALADSGEGETQVLPVLLLGALAKLNRLGSTPVLVLEQPEMHLHSSAERDLAALICSIVKRSGTTLVIETHSENLLLFIQLAMANEQLKPSDVAIYFVRQRPGEEGSTASEIILDDFGRPKNWPPGVFSEDVQIARDLLLAQRRRQAPAPSK